MWLPRKAINTPKATKAHTLIGLGLMLCVALSCKAMVKLSGDSPSPSFAKQSMEMSPLSRKLATDSTASPTLLSPQKSTKALPSLSETLEIELPANGLVPRPYQRPLWRYLQNGGTHAVAVWHRRGGKDDVALHHAACSAHKRIGTYWHMLPEYAQARKAIWNAINPNTKRRRIDDAFPHALRKRTNEQEMFIEFKCGSTWQVVGSDNFNALVGSPPVGIVFSEWSIANPSAYAMLSPILAENNGWAVFIYTSRGYNHGHSTYQSAKDNPGAFAELLTVDDTGVISQEILERQRRTYIDLYGPEAGDAFYRQEFYNDWSASNIGAVLGAAIERADKSGRIVDFKLDNEPVTISSDLGRRDTATWWYWVPRLGGFDLVDYDQGVGMDAEQWIDRIKARGHKIEKIWLPHDARVKTFQSNYSAIEQFIDGFGAERMGIVPRVSIADRINAGRRVVERCRFHKTNCKDGLNGLRSWSFDYDAEKKIMSSEPRHDWASHIGDGYTYGAQVLEELLPPPPPPPDGRRIIVGANEITMNDMWELTPAQIARI